MTRPAVILGAGGHAKVIASLLPERTVTFFGRENEDLFFGELDPFRNADVYLGVGDIGIRQALFERLRKAGIEPAICIAPTAFVAASAKIGSGTVILPGAVISAEAEIGNSVIVNTLSSVDHECRVGDHTHISVGVHIPGNVRIGASCFWGVQSACFPGLTIGDRVIVRAGSLVTKDVASGSVVGGSPARVLRESDLSGLGG